MVATKLPSTVVKQGRLRHVAVKLQKKKFLQIVVRTGAHSSSNVLLTLPLLAPNEPPASTRQGKHTDLILLHPDVMIGMSETPAEAINVVRAGKHKTGCNTEARLKAFIELIVCKHGKLMQSMAEQTLKFTPDPGPPHWGIFISVNLGKSRHVRNDVQRRLKLLVIAVTQGVVNVDRKDELISKHPSVVTFGKQIVERHCKEHRKKVHPVVIPNLVNLLKSIHFVPVIFNVKLPTFVKHGI